MRLSGDLRVVGGSQQSRLRRNRRSAGRIFTHRCAGRERPQLPPTGSPDRHGAGTSVRRCMPHGFIILTAKPIAGHDAKGQRREPGQDDPDAAGAPRTWIRTGDRRHAQIIGVPRTGIRPCPRTPRQSQPPRPRPPRRSSKRLPETSVSLPGITLSDEGGQGERARSRRYERLRGTLGPSVEARRIG